MDVLIFGGQAFDKIETLKGIVGCDPTLPRNAIKLRITD
jgi:hypothetical protein